MKLSKQEYTLFDNKVKSTRQKSFVIRKRGIFVSPFKNNVMLYDFEVNRKSHGSEVVLSITCRSNVEYRENTSVAQVSRELAALVRGYDCSVSDVSFDPRRKLYSAKLRARCSSKKESGNLEQLIHQKFQEQDAQHAPDAFA